MQCQKHEKGAAVLNDHEKNHLKWATRAPHVRLTCASCVAVTCYETRTQPCGSAAVSHNLPDCQALSKMLQSRSFVKKTKKGKVLKVVREHYLRDDIYSGSPLDPECDQDAAKLSASAPHYLIVDTNIVLQQVRNTAYTTLVMLDLLAPTDS